MVEEIESLEEVMKAPRKGWPTFDDFQHGCVFIDNELIKKVEDLLQKHRCCLIRGAEGRGKTVLARVVGFNKYKEKWKIRFIDVREVRRENIAGVCNYIKEIGDKKFLFIVENAHFSLDEITSELIESANEHQEASFIFTSRKIFPGKERHLIPNPFEEWEEKGWYVDLKPGLEMTRGIINTFISAKDMDYSITEQDESWVEREFGKQAVNLRRLNWYLETWSKKDGSLSSVKKEEVLEDVLKYFLKELNDSNLEEMFLKVAGIFQFDVDFCGRDYNKAILTELVKRVVITFVGRDCYRLQHSSDAAYIIEAVAILREERDPEAITIDIFKEYLQRKPENYHELMRALFQSKGKRIFSEIFREQKTYDAIFDMIKQDHIRVMSSVLGYFTWACGKERGLEFWSQYKKSEGDSLEEQKEKLKSKLTEASCIEVMFLLLFLRNVDVTEKDWLANEVLDEGDLAKKAEYASFLTIRNFIHLLPTEKASAVISKLDPNDLAKKAKFSSLQTIMWFLMDCSMEPSNINFVKLFLLAVNKDEDVLAKKAEDAPFSVIRGLVGVLPSKIASAFLSKLDPDDLAKKAKNLDLSIVWGCLKTIKKINPDFHEDLKSSLTPYWLQIYLSSNLNNIVRALYHIAPQTKFARLIVQNVASTELSGPIRKLYSHPETEPLKVLGKLLDRVHQIAFVTDKDAVEKIAQQIVDLINFKAHETYDPEQLSLIVKNTKKCNEVAGEQLCRRILSELNLTDYIRIPFEKGSAELVWEIYLYDEEKGKELANEIFKLDFNKLLDSSETKMVKLLLWNLLQINESKVRSWIQDMDEEKFLPKILSASTPETFRLLWNLYQIDEEKGKSVAQSLANNVLSGLTVIEAEDLPLLGFFVFCDIKLDLDMPIPSPCKIAERIVKDPKLAELGFCLCFLEKEDDALLKEFFKELGRCLFLGNLTFSPKERIEKYPTENTRQLLTKIFKDFDIPTEPDSTFVEMIRLTKTYLEEKKKTKVAFSQLRDFFLSNPTNNPIFKLEKDAEVWLSVAINNYGIYHEEQVPHHKDPSWTVNLLSLKKDIGSFYPFLNEREV